MIEPLQLLWILFIVIMAFALVVLLEIQRSYYRREHEVMFGTPLFDAQVQELGFLPDEVKVRSTRIRMLF